MIDKFTAAFFVYIGWFIAALPAIISINDETIVSNGNIELIKGLGGPFRVSFFVIFFVFIGLKYVIYLWKGFDSQDFKQIFPFWNSAWSMVIFKGLPLVFCLFYVYISSKTHNFIFIIFPMIYFIALTSDFFRDSLIKTLIISILISIFSFLVICGEFSFLNISLTNTKINISDYVSLNNSKLINVSLINSELKDIDFSNSVIKGCKFKGIDIISRCKFTNSIILGTSFSTTKSIENCNFDNISTFDDNKAIYEKTKFDSTLITNTSFKAANLFATFKNTELSAIFDSKSDIVKSDFNHCNLVNSQGLTLSHIEKLSLSSFDSLTRFPPPLNEYAQKKLAKYGIHLNNK